MRRGIRAAGLGAVVGVAAIAVACSSGSKSKGGGGLASGNYTTSSFSATNDGCGVAVDPGSVDLFVSGANVAYDGAVEFGTIDTTVSGGQLTGSASSKSYDQDPFFGSGVFCTITTTDQIQGSISGNTVDVTETVSNSGTGAQCAAETNLPCTTVMTYTLTKAGATVNPSPAPTPTLLAGSGNATASTQSPLISDSTDAAGAYTPGLHYDLALTGGAGNAATTAWYCFKDATFSSSYGVVSSDYNLTMLVSTAAWSVGSHAIDPDNTIYVSITGTNGETAIATGGTMNIQKAGTTPDTVGQNCQFSFSGVTFNADVTPFRAPHRAPRVPRK